MSLLVYYFCKYQVKVGMPFTGAGAVIYILVIQVAYDYISRALVFLSNNHHSSTSTSTTTSSSSSSCFIISFL